ncbi:MAG: hypothetical protein RLZZ485_204 [Actinomycetota bacterium]
MLTRLRRVRTGLSGYGEVLKSPGALRLLVSAFPSRMAYGMVSLAIYFKVHQETNSIAVAGLAAGANALAGATTAGIRGWIIDRYGMHWPLRTLVPLYAAMLIALGFGQDERALVILAAVLGFSAPPINLSVRPLWKVTVSEEKLRTAYALDTAAMNASSVIAPVIATWLSISYNARIALILCASLMLLGGFLILLTSQVKIWRPEKKEEDTLSLWRVRGIQLLALEGVVMGIGWGMFDIAIPALGTLEGMQNRVGTIFAVMAAFNVVGGLIAGTLSRKVSALKAFRLNYLLWAILSIPLAFTHFNWSLGVTVAFLAFLGGAQQVFYWEITEAVRPKGTAVQALAWLWTIEGSAAALAIAAGGFISEHLSPRYCLFITTIALFIGFFIITLGKRALANADRIPTAEEDLRAMEETSDTTR